MANNIPKRKVGRPRNAAVDELASELGVTTRRVRQMQQSGELPGSIAGRATATGATIASVRLRRALAEAERSEIALQSERLEARRVAGDLMRTDDAIRFILTSLEAVSQGLKNAPHRYGQRANPENPDAGRCAVEAMISEVGQLVAVASRKVAETGTAL